MFQFLEIKVYRDLGIIHEITDSKSILSYILSSMNDNMVQFIQCFELGLRVQRSPLEPESFIYIDISLFKEEPLGLKIF